MTNPLLWKTTTARSTDYPYNRGPQTPWGRADAVYELARGVKWVGTPSHGGLQVARGVAQQQLTPAARRLGDYKGGYYWYEEDVQYSIAFYEHPEWDIALAREGGGKISTKEQHESTIRKYFPKYFEMGGLVDKPNLAPGMKLRLTIGHSLPTGSVWEVEKVTSSLFIGRNIATGERYKFRLGDYITSDRFELIPD